MGQGFFGAVNCALRSSHNSPSSCSISKESLLDDLQRSSPAKATRQNPGIAIRKPVISVGRTRSLQRGKIGNTSLTAADTVDNSCEKWFRVLRCGDSALLRLKATAITQTEKVATDFWEFKAYTRVEIASYKAAQIRNEEVVKSLSVVVDEKELAAKAQGASDEMKSHIRILKNSIDRLNATESSNATNPQ